jgi:hypothetical protein
MVRVGRGAAGYVQFFGESPVPWAGQRTFTRTQVLDDAPAVIEVMKFVITLL